VARCRWTTKRRVPAPSPAAAPPDGSGVRVKSRLRRYGASFSGDDRVRDAGTAVVYPRAAA
jgi:hypothetical protein